MTDEHSTDLEVVHDHDAPELLRRTLSSILLVLACLVLADLSLSTDAWVSDTQRVIDVIRDSLLLFGEALGSTGETTMYARTLLARRRSKVAPSSVRFRSSLAADMPERC